MTTTSNRTRSWLLACLLLLALQGPLWAANHIWEKVEITLRAQKPYANPYTDVVVWVDLKGPGFAKRCYGFWDGGDVFRVRVMATAPGNWTWKSGATPADPGLTGVTGSFTAEEWTPAEKAENPCRRGMIQPSANGHAFQHADGTPWFMLGDTWWATPTFRFRWRDDDTLRPLGPQAGFKEFVAYRRKQAFNCIAIIAALPNWANDGKPANLKMPDGTVLRSAWKQAGTESAKAMSDEAGQRAFLFPGKVPGYENDFPDLERINPGYFQSMDLKIDYLNAQGFVPFIEVSRRDLGQAWKKFYPWPDSYVRYIQYIWARYQANICLYSPIHFDSAGGTIPAADYNAAANLVIERFGHPPFGTLAGTNPSGSSLRNWGHVDQARWLGFHQIGNLRTHDSYALLTEIFQARPPVPGINGEPYYDGMENLAGGSAEASFACRSAMYGSVLSGGLGGHIYGGGGWQGGIWSGEVEEASPAPMWQVFAWPAAGQMRHLKSFILSEGARYQDLEPCADRIAPNRSGTAKAPQEWAFGAGTAARDLYLLYFERGCSRATLAGVKPGATYAARWYNPQNGNWNEAAIALTANAAGTLTLPPFPGEAAKSDTDWALKLTLADAAAERRVIPAKPDTGTSITAREMQAVYERVKTPYKYGIVVKAEGEGNYVDCPSVFRHGGRWFMIYVQFNKGIGYETMLARSDDLLNWQPLGTIMSYRRQGWDAWQSAGYIALQDTAWGGSVELEPYDGKYWISYIGGAKKGYETDPLAMGMAWTKDPARPVEWQRLPEPVLTRDQPDARFFEKLTQYKSHIIHDRSESLGYPFVMFYNGKTRSGYERIGMAVSRDMTTWLRYGTEPVIDNGRGISGDPQVVRLGDLWVMFYFGAHWKPKAFDTFACSRDLVHWTKWTGPNLIAPSEPWDKTYAHKPWLIEHNGVVYHFYCAVGSQGRAIAVATSKDLRKTQK